MIWANFFHIYQPPNQMPDILERIVNESYRKIIKGLKQIPQAKISLNINAGLTEQLYSGGYQDVIDDLRSLAKNGQIEFVESAKYHAFLPLIPEDEIIRQIKLNHEANKYYFGEAYSPCGFFPPEMAYHRKVAEAVASLGYKWMIIDEIAFSGKVDTVDYSKAYIIKGLGDFKVFFRERRLSNLIMGAVVRTGESLLEAMGEERKKDRYLLTAMDGETFGHHRPGLEKLLFEILKSNLFKKVTISEISQHFPFAKVIDPLPSTWSATEKDLEENSPYISWFDPKNIIHKWQWEFNSWVIERIAKLNPSDPGYEEIRKKLDAALASDHCWWASAKPWWSLEIIEAGAFKLLDAIRSIKNISEDDLKKAEDYYQKIIFKAFEWQRTGYVRELSEEQMKWIKVPFKERKPIEEYSAVLEAMEREIKKAVKRQEFEKAILWRDAIHKLKNNLDVYDTIHVVDLLRKEASLQDLDALIKKYKAKYNKIKSGQPG